MLAGALRARRLREMVDVLFLLLLLVLLLLLLSSMSSSLLKTVPQGKQPCPCHCLPHDDKMKSSWYCAIAAPKALV